MSVKFSTAAAIAVFLVCAPAIAMAQPQTLNPGQSDPSQPAGDSGETPDLSFGNLQGSEFTSAYGMLQSPSSVTVVEVRDSQQFGVQDIARLRADVRESPEAMRALRVNGLTAEDVVGVEASSDRAITLYVRG